MKKKLLILYILVLFALLFTACNSNKKDNIDTELVFMKGFPAVIEMYEGDKLSNQYIMFKGIVDFKNNNVVFISSNESVVTVDVSTQEFPIYTYFDIIAHSQGEAIIYAQSVDGSVISEPVKITVLPALETEDQTEITTDTDVESDVESETESNAESLSDTNAEVETEPQKETHPEESKEVTYILNTNSKKFHLPSCSFVSRMNEANKAEFCGDRSELIKQGYAACKSCEP